MRRKGCADAATIHSLIYTLDEDDRLAEPRFVLNSESIVGEADLIIIDEVSMVGEDLGRDLLSFGRPVLVLGDPAQLPPVKGQGFFTEAEPNVMLTEVHRQAKESPIIRLATDVREGGRLEVGGEDGARVIRRADIDATAVLAADQILVGLNKTRHAYNQRVRALNGIDGVAPVAGEKLVCLRNDSKKKLLNGSLWLVEEAPAKTKTHRKNRTTPLVVAPEEGGRRKSIDVTVKDEFWSGEEGKLTWQDKRGTEEFTFGYALTVHKSQGSQWDRIIVFDEAAAFREDAWRWRYTAITRAAKDLTVVV